jgi:drug/metabolite transporter (DMT)-like permease
MIFGTFVAALASFHFKKASSGTGFISILKSKSFYLGGFLYLVSSIVTICLLQLMPYSVIVPLGGVCYIWTLLISYRFLGEKITVYKIAGIVFIIVGILFLWR